MLCPVLVAITVPLALKMNKYGLNMAVSFTPSSINSEILKPLVIVRDDVSDSVLLLGGFDVSSFVQENKATDKPKRMIIFFIHINLGLYMNNRKFICLFYTCDFFFLLYQKLILFR